LTISAEREKLGLELGDNRTVRDVISYFNFYDPAAIGSAVTRNPKSLTGHSQTSGDSRALNSHAKHT
jgi:hypothetical protein